MERSIDKTYNNNQSLSSSSLSKTMILLKNQSATKARKYVESKFKKPADLQDIAGIRIQLEKQLQQTDSQLNTVVQAKLEAFKRSVDLMDEATNKLSQFSKIMTSVDYKISQANTEISQFPYLKRVNNIKENLDKVINQIEYFADVPEKDVELRKMLLEEPDKLREVFLESVKLDSLRSALVKEIGDGKEDAELRVSVEEYLKTVPVLAAAIVSRILTFMQGSANHDVDAGLDDLIVSQGEGAFRDFIDHALLSPADLVAHFEVVELHQEYFDRRVRADSSLIAVSTSATPVALPVHRNTVRNRPVSTLRPGLENYNIRPRVLLAMTEALSKRVKDCFRTHNEAALENKTSQVTALLDAGSDLIKLLVDLINDVDPCVPPSYGLVPLYFGVLMAELTPRIDDVCARVQQVKLAEIIDLMDWLRYFVEQMDRFRLRDQPCCDQFLVLCEEVLLMEYLERLKTQLADLFQNIQSQASQMVVESAEGRQLTSAPEDMFNVAYVQLGVARDGLPADFLKHALVAVFQVLGEVQRSSHDTLAKRWRLFNPVQLCAVINDNRRMQGFYFNIDLIFLLLY